MALTDSLQLSESKDRNGNVCHRKSPNRNLLHFTKKFKESRLENSVSIGENSWSYCENSLFHYKNSLPHCENSVLCLHQVKTKLDNLEMKNLTYSNIVHQQNNNVILDKCENICPGQMVHFFSSDLDSDKYEHNEWITRNSQDRCFVNDSLLISDNDCRVQCCDVNDFKNVTLRINDLNSNDMERKTKTSSRRDSGDEEDNDAKRPRTEQDTSTDSTSTILYTPSSSTDARASLATTAIVSESTSGTFTSIEAQRRELSSTLEQTCESEKASAGPISSEIENVSKEPILGRATELIRVTKSMKSCSIETKQASSESPTSSSRPVSIIAPIDSSVTVSTRSQSSQSDLVLPSVSCDLYLDSLLDQECSLYTSRLTSVVHEVQPNSDRDTINPVSVLLNQGDEKHFIPINDSSDDDDE